MIKKAEIYSQYELPVSQLTEITMDETYETAILVDTLTFDNE